MTPCKGFFRPMEGAQPHIGTVGDTIERVDEIILQFWCMQDQLELLHDVIKRHHPYEEVTVDIISLVEYKT